MPGRGPLATSTLGPTTAEKASKGSSASQPVIFGDLTEKLPNKESHTALTTCIQTRLREPGDVSHTSNPSTQKSEADTSQ